MRSGLRRSRMHDARRAASPSVFSTPRSTSTPAFDESCPPSNPTLNFLRATDGRSNGRRVSSLMTGVALLNRFVSRSRNQNHESNCGFPLHPSLISVIWVDKKGCKLRRRKGVVPQTDDVETNGVERYPLQASSREDHEPRCRKRRVFGSFKRVCCRWHRQNRLRKQDRQ